MAVADGELKVVGTRPIRHDGVDKVTGRARYGVDATMPGMVHGKVLRSPHARARIKRLDTSRAEAAGIVLAVVTGADIPDPGEGMAEANESGLQSLRYRSERLLADDRVTYEGQALAAVAAASIHEAEAALDLIEVEYEVLPPVLDVRAAMQKDAPIVLDDLRTDTGGERGDEPTNIAKHIVYEEGDVQQGFAAADLVMEREYTTSMVHQGYIEPQNALAYWNPDGHLFVESSSQGHFGIRDELSEVLRRPISTITVQPAEIGGGFGGKTTIYLEPIAALLSKKAGRPVKMTMTRAEVLQGTGPAPGAYMRVKLGVTKAGKLTAAEVYLAFEAGGYPGSAIGAGVLTCFGPYSLENFRIDGFDVVLNKPKSHAYRAPGAPQAEFSVESLVDEICRELKMDPLEFRLLNASKEGDLRSNGTRFHRIGNVETLQTARASDHWQSALGVAAAGKRRGRGMGSGYWMNGGGKSSATARLNADGTVTLLEGSMDIGGTRTSIAMQAAETLGIRAEDVQPIVPDTDNIAFTGVTGGSRVTFATGWAAIEAARDLQRQMVEALADAWDVASDEIEIGNGSFGHNGTQANFKQAAEIIDEEGLEIVGKATITPDGSGNTFAVHIVDVEIDEETGKTEILRYTALQDAGKAVYPPYVEGQMEGGVAQGIGWALNEEYVYDDDGHLRNSSLLDYRMPTTLDIPMIESIIVEVPNPGHPYGVRGAGEIPIVPPLATITNAIYDAIGARMRDLPASPRKVQAALAAATAP
jgi:xanthine dehydrogenase molybdenum-binding subunit